ncbi:MAG: beta-galactosidase [Ruminococcaceae bacterium]|nr:beta-galactosidase [Oscillospiraceae bacterium]
MLEIKNGKFYLDGEPYTIYSGAMHYFRILPEYWEDRLMKLKACGFNTVETYVCWNLHEPKKGEFDFSGRLDIVRYIKTAEKLGLNVILRPGPYICAEWDFGGFPAWLLRDKNIRLRCNDEIFLGHVRDFFNELLSLVAPLQKTRGGNIIAMQIENEYGSYGNDKKYLERIKQIFIDNSIDVLFFTSDGDEKSMIHGGGLSGVYKTLNFGSRAATVFKALDGIQDNMPKMCMEFWCGWFDHWGDKHHTREYQSIIKEIEAFFAQDASFNFYMFHGGTNFGFTAGANHKDVFEPTVTSYDYCALLNEYGDYTPAYHAVRDILHKKQNLPLSELPPSPQRQHIGIVKLEEKTGLFENMENIGEKHYSPLPEGMEYFGQNFGMIYYKTVVQGAYGLMELRIKDLHDRAYLYLNGKYKKTYEYKPVKQNFISKLLNKASNAFNFNKDANEIGILVDAMGRVNYGEHITDRKGISGLFLNLQQLMDFEVTCLPLDNLEKLDYNLGAEKYPMFFKGKFRAEPGKECFVRFDHFTKGNIYINGFNLGRFWDIGPQRTLYLPGSLLKEENEIVVLELEKCVEPQVIITDKPDLG